MQKYERKLQPRTTDLQNTMDEWAPWDDPWESFWDDDIRDEVPEHVVIVIRYGDGWSTQTEEVMLYGFSGH